MLNIGLVKDAREQDERPSGRYRSVREMKNKEYSLKKKTQD